MSKIPGPHILLTESAYITLITPAGVYLISRKTGEIEKFVPEHPILEKQSAALAAGVTILLDTEGVRGFEELRVQVGKLLVSLSEKMTTQVKAKTA